MYTYGLYRGTIIGLHLVMCLAIAGLKECNYVHTVLGRSIADGLS